jgi:hypothetical protein
MEPSGGRARGGVLVVIPPTSVRSRAVPKRARKKKADHGRKAGRR